MDHTAATRIIALSLCIIALPCLSQTAPHPTTPAPANFAGCVQHSATDKNILILNGETVCAKLTGTFSSEKILGHEVDLKGVLTERTTSNPASIDVRAVNSIGKTCSSTCSLRPPGTRGLGGEKPGKEGGTPGMAPKTPPQ